MYSTKYFKELSKDEVLSRVSQYDLFLYYIDGYKGNNKTFCSELRKDKNPSCAIKIYEDGGAMYKDFTTGDSYNCFGYIMTRYNCSFMEALKIINSDFNLGLDGKGIQKPSPVLIGHEKKPKATVSVIKIKSRPWNNGIDKSYWGDYYIACKTLVKYNVIPCSHVWVNDNCFKAKEGNPFYAYKFDLGIYKLMSPFGDKKFKWISNTSYSHVQGLAQLRTSGDLLILTKSLKDVMVLDTLGYNAVALQSEASKIPLEIFNNLRTRFKKIIIFYDNDTTGKMFRGRLLEEYDYFSGYIEFKEGTKDVSDYIKINGVENTNYKLKELLEYAGVYYK